MPPKRKPESDSGFSESDRARLDEMLKDREFEDRLKDLRKSRWDIVKAWAQWLTAVALGWNILREIGAVSWSHIRHWLGLPS